MGVDMTGKDDGMEAERHYHHTLRKLQMELVKLQRHLIRRGERVLVIIEGRDAAGKDGAIKRLTEHMSPRDTRIHAPGKPSDVEQGQWYFQRFVPFLPAAGEFVIFNRSWYNRAGVERVMGFCTAAQVEDFFHSICPFETMLMRDGLHLRKFYLDISRREQAKRLAERVNDPLKQWKISPVDEAAQDKWKDYSKARNEMFRRSSHAGAPWHVVRSDEKKIARLELLRDLLDGFSYPGKKAKLTAPDLRVAAPWSRNLRLSP
jgi:polyphosphate kinase